MAAKAFAGSPAAGEAKVKKPPGVSERQVEGLLRLRRHSLLTSTAVLRQLQDIDEQEFALNEVRQTEQARKNMSTC